MLAVYKRELNSYFRNPTGYIALALFAFLSGFIFINKFNQGSVDMSAEIISLRNYFLVIVPVVTMGLFSEDKRRGTDILYYTTPSSLFSIVIGKFLAAMTLLGIMFINVIIQMIVTVKYGGTVNIGTFGSCLVYFFLASLFIAVGVFASALTDSQIISAIVSFVIIVLITVISNIASTISNSLASVLSVFGFKGESLYKFCDKVEDGINWVNPLTKSENFRYGIFSVAPLFYCISLTLVFLYLTYRVLDKKRWSQK